jgi:hypothetical protein
MEVKKTYRVPCTWQMYGYVNVEASDWDDAVEEAYADEVPLPKDGEYVISSFEVDHEGIECEEEEENKILSFPTGNDADFGTSME